MKTASAVRFYDHHPGIADLREEVLKGLATRPKSIPPKFFYDERGSQLFDAICELPEYYLTRTEIGLLRKHCGEIAELAGSECLLIELGSGASKKVRLLLEAVRPASYVGVDISKDFLLQATARLAADYPWLDVQAACADFSRHLNLSYCPSAFRKLAFFPGSSIGNFEPEQAVVLLRQLRKTLSPDGALLIGVDLKKDPRVLHAAYNDAQGITADFNRNLLWRIRNELDTDLEPESFEHQAFYNERQGRVEMHLLSSCTQSFKIEGRDFRFVAGETVHTENSYKYGIEEFQDLARQAGYRPEQVWTDEKQLFSVHYLHLNGVTGA
ncbi:MAG: L-histidine N(alpha)-methyltransferase [Gammaproteobacteria bacterium]|nr:L-histidine N(alpha)-methyltransferase [Gammaproteobacteria bacterium]